MMDWSFLRKLALLRPIVSTRGRAVPYALGAVGLGMVGIVYRDFALQWQPVPAGLPGREALAVLCGVLLIIGGFALMLPRIFALAALGAAILDLLWVSVLLLPKAIGSPQNVVAWLGVAEILALSAGGAMLLATALAFQRLAVGARMTFGICALVFGTSHFVYAGFTAAMVPQWLPAPLLWAYATGVGHVLAGIALMLGRCTRLAPTLLAAMCGSFVLLVHLPRVVAEPSSHAEWTGLFMALSIAGAAWTLRGLPVAAVSDGCGSPARSAAVRAEV